MRVRESWRRTDGAVRGLKLGIKRLMLMTLTIRALVDVGGALGAVGYF